MKTFVKLSMVATLSLATLTTSVLAVDELTTLDTLIIYSQGTADKYGEDAETRINHLIETTNKIYVDSGLNVKLNPVKIQQYEMDDAATSGTILGGIRKSAEVAEIRNEVGADHVIMYRPYAGDGACGLAYLNTYLNNPDATWVEKYMYAHVSVDCGGYVTSHEVGHNSGLGHSEKQGSTGAYEYARGHGVQDNFTTVMAYSGVYNGSKIYKYSSPTLECNGLPCGIEEGEDKAADAVKALKQTLPLIENFRAHIDVPDNNDTDDNNDTTDDGADKLAAALKAYNDQKDLFATDKTKLKELRDLSKEKRAEFLDAREEYLVIRQEFNEVRAEFKEIIVDFRAARAEFRDARNAYRAKTISRNEYLEARAYYIEVRDELRAYRSEEYKPVLAELRAYRAEVLKPIYAEYKETRVAVKEFYESTYKVSKAKLEEFKKAYLALKNA